MNGERWKDKIHEHVKNRQPVGICYDSQGTQRCSVTTLRVGSGQEVGRRFKRGGRRAGPCVIYVDV